MIEYRNVMMALMLSWFFACSMLAQTVKDIGGNVYQTVTIGKQTWMKENLTTTRYSDGSPIATGLSNDAWAASTTGAYAIYENNNEWHKQYGKCYNGYVVLDSRKVCPTGWHIPTSEEWTTLINYLGGDTAAGVKLKAPKGSGWEVYLPSTEGNNSSGFSALPAGGRKPNDGTYYGLRISGYWWSATPVDGKLNALALYREFPTAFIKTFPKAIGASIRCLKD